MKKFIAIVFLFAGFVLESQLANAATQTVHDENTKLDTACHPARTKAPLPNIEQDEDTTYDLDLTAYGTAGDPSVTASADCGDLAPTVSVTGGPAGLSVDLTNPKIPRLKTGVGGFTTAGSGTGTVHWDNSVALEATSTFAWVINPVGGSVDPPITQTCAASRFVREDGNDNLDGCTHATAWRTVGKVRNTVIPVGVDVWFNNDDVWTGADTYLPIDWSGTLVNPAILGAYYVASGVAYRGLTDPGDLLSITAMRTDFDPGSRPWIRGTLIGCRPDCLQTASEYYDRWWQVVYPSQHVRIENLEISDVRTAGLGMTGGGSGLGDNGYAFYLEVDGVYVHDALMSGFIGNTSRYWELRNSAFRWLNLLHPDGSRFDGGHTINSGPSAIGSTNVRAGNGLVENIRMRDNWGEDAGLYSGGAYVVRGSWFGSSGRICGYISPGGDQLYEQNICVHDNTTPPDTHGTVCQERCGFRPFSGIQMTIEPSTTSAGGVINSTNTRPSVSRNNLIFTNTLGFGWTVHQEWNNTLSNWGGFYGNAIVRHSGTSPFIRVTLTASSLITTNRNLDFRDNIFAMVAGTAVCEYTSASNPRIDHNHWAASATGINANCREGGDVFSNSYGFSLAPFASLADGAYPEWSDFVPTDGAGDGAGIAQTDVIDWGPTTGVAANEPDPAWVHSQFEWVPPGGDPNPSFAEWSKFLGYDFQNKPRTGACANDIGAFCQ